MRMWRVDPKLLCRKHLLGAHVETHMAVGAINKGKSLEGYYRGLLDIAALRDEHDILAKEMLDRGYRHNSPLPEFKAERIGWVDSALNLLELRRRCPACAERIERRVDVKEAWE